MLNTDRTREIAFFGLGGVTLLAVISGCTVGPDYIKPATATPAAWIGAPGSSSGDRSNADLSHLVRWWTTLGDPTLDALVRRALSGNLGLVQAEARIRQARAVRTIAASAGLPTLDASGSATRSRTPARGRGSTGNLFRAGFDAGWEIDVFGGVRRSVEAGDAGIQSAVEDARDVRVTLLAELAGTYVDLRAAQEQLQITQRNLAAQERTLDLTRRRQGAGFVGKLDVANAESQVASTRARLPTIEATVRQSMYAMATLLGLEPGSLIDELSPQAPLAALPPSVPAGLPSDLLERRPDIRRAEADLHAATARIGVATADLYPKFSLSGSVGFQGGQLSSLGTLAQRYWSIGPAVQWPVFHAGAINAGIEQQQALTDEALSVYKGTVLTALQEVENALIAYDRELERTRSLDQNVRASEDAVRLADDLYRAGKTDFLNVLNAQRSLLDAESARLDSRRLSLTNLIALFKSLGGGWDSAAASADGAGEERP